jgi:hypothetical protein
VHKQQFIALATLLVALTASVIAEQGGTIRRDEPQRVQGNEIERSAVNFAQPWRPGGLSTTTKVIGTVIDIRQVPVAKATVQLRNLDTGNVEQTTESDDEGGYAFDLEDPGTFVVEMVMLDGHVIALSNAGSLARYETLQTVVQLPGRWDGLTRSMIMPQSLTNFFGMSSATSMTATTITIAADANITPANPGVPVSP